jgi:hypothetical protein
MSLRRDALYEALLGVLLAAALMLLLSVAYRDAAPRDVTPCDDPDLDAFPVLTMAGDTLCVTNAVRVAQ